MIKIVLAAAVAGAAGFALPSVGVDECAVVSTDIERAEATPVDPDPAAEAVRIIVYCGHQVSGAGGTVRTERALKVIDLDVQQATVLVEAAGELLLDGDVFLSDGRG